MIQENASAHRKECEIAFRRGFQHGMQEAMIWLIDQLPSTMEMDYVTPRLQEKANRWLERVQDWRRGVDERGTMVPPPDSYEEQEKQDGC